MRRNDLLDDLLMESGDISVTKWVSSFFNGELHYGASLERRKLTPSEIRTDFIEFYAKRENIAPEELTKMILNQETHTLFNYRASWREDLLELVYVPKLNKFIHYGQGEY